MPTALLAALLLSSPLAMAQDAPTTDAKEGAEEGAEGAADQDELPAIDLDLKIESCSKLTLMSPCEVEGQIGLCQLEPCETDFKDGARACKQCVTYALKPTEPEPEEPEPMLDEAEAKKGKKRRRRKKRDCGCSNASANLVGMAFALPLAPLVIRRRRR